ncbi:AMP-binding protein [Nocardia altamirensis]|uniref:AMP-binding protein n=1 Tax=Nocardia altamirensis TaxID=472158 RepID=UPI0008403929|nr:AMP-binding protein [Nocardia altamirensis]
MPELLRFGASVFDSTDRGIDEKPLDSAYLEILSAFVADTADSCSFHGKRLAEAGFHGGPLRSYAEFGELPLLAPGEVSSVPDGALLPDRLAAAAVNGLFGLASEERIARKFLTTSSTGRPKGSYYTHEDWAAATQFGDRLMREAEPADYARMFNGFHNGHVAGKLMEDIFTTAGCVVENNHHLNATPEQILGQLADGLSAFGGFNAMALPPWRPKHLAGNKGATLDTLLDEDIDNVIGAQIRVIVGGGAPFPSDGSLQERTWSANDLAGWPPSQFIHTYGSAEVGIAAVGCSAGPALHVLQGFIYTEVLDEQTGEHVPDGGRGLVVLTGLKHGSRYLRYLVGDEATYLEGACACGRTSPRLLDIQRVLELERLNTGCAAGGV